MARDYSSEYERRDELAQERGFDSFYDQRHAVDEARSIVGNVEFDIALSIASLQNDYEPGDASRDDLADWWEENIGPIDYDDPDDPFWDFLDALSGE